MGIIDQIGAFMPHIHCVNWVGLVNWVLIFDVLVGLTYLVFSINQLKVAGKLRKGSKKGAGLFHLGLALVFLLCGADKIIHALNMYQGWAFSLFAINKPLLLAAMVFLIYRDSKLRAEWQEATRGKSEIQSLIESFPPQTAPEVLGRIEELLAINEGRNIISQNTGRAILLCRFIPESEGQPQDLEWLEFTPEWANKFKDQVHRDAPEFKRGGMHYADYFPHVPERWKEIHKSVATGYRDKYVEKPGGDTFSDPYGEHEISFGYEIQYIRGTKVLPGNLLLMTIL